MRAPKWLERGPVSLEPLPHPGQEREPPGQALRAPVSTERVPGLRVQLPYSVLSREPVQEQPVSRALRARGLGWRQGPSVLQQRSPAEDRKSVV